MFRNLLANWAHNRALANLRRCGDARTAESKRRFLHRSYFWGDVECWIEGLGTWRDLSARRRRRTAPRVRTINTLGLVLLNPITLFLGIIIAWFIISLFMSFALMTAHAEEKNWSQADPARSAWFKGLMQPDTGVSCCSVADCRKTTADWRSGQWWAVVDGTWTPIPPNKVLKGKQSIDGEAYVCAGIARTIFCFIPGWSGF